MTLVGERYRTNNFTRINFILNMLIVYSMQVKRLIDHDPRYDSVESSVVREGLFRDYCRKLEAEDEEEMARKEDERRQRDRKARYNLIVF